MKNWLPYFMKQADINDNQLAKAVGTDRQQIKKLRKEGRDIRRAWAVRLVKGFKKLRPDFQITAIELLHGPEVVVDSLRNAQLAPVVGESAAGTWRERDVWDTEKYQPVPAIPNVFPGIPQSAYRIEGPSMDKLRIFDGEFVLTVPYFEARATIQDGDIVIVERTRGETVEITCKQVAISPSGTHLWPRSTDPKFQTPIQLSTNPEPSDGHGETVEIVALVVGRFSYV